METILNIDVGEIVLAIVTLILAFLPVIARKLNGMHRLMNSGFTEQKRERVDDALEYLAVLEGVFGAAKNPAQQKVVDHIKRRVERLQAEIERRDAQAGQVKGFPSDGGE